MIRVDRLRPDEGERLRALRLRALALDPDAFYSTLEREEALDAAAWSARLAEPATATLVLRDEGGDAGLVACGPSRHAEDAGSGIYHLTAMWIDPRARGSGAADALVEAALRHARAEGATRLVLWAASANERAVRLYARHGFAPTGATGAFPPPRATPEIEMALDPTGAAAGPTERAAADAIAAGDLVVGDDGLARPRWAARDALLRDYYDREWGRPVRDERGVFERLSLEAFQSGLSWVTILRKRSAFRAAFAGFDPDVVAAMGDGDVARLMADAAIVRNRRKIEATIGNARATVALRPEGGLAELVWSFRPERTPEPRLQADVPARSPESAALAAALRARGFAFVGPTTIFALMEAIGIVDTHLVGSHRRGSSGVWT